MRYQVNEIFQSVQGEGWLTGMPAVFVRMQGCLVGCPWCDTKETWEADPATFIVPEAMLDKTRSGTAHWSTMSEDDIASHVASLVIERTLPLIVITGGEPAAQDLRPLVLALKAKFGWRPIVQIETSGTYLLRIAEAWVTVSPKVNMPGGRELVPDTVQYANELKMVLGRAQDVETLKTVLGMMNQSTAKICVQPIWGSERARELATNVATAYGFRLSLQTHKMVGVR